MQQKTLVAPSTSSEESGVRRNTSILHIRWGSVFIYLLLFIGSIFFIAPFFWMLSSAFKLPQEVISYPPVWIPASPTMRSILYVWDKMNFARSFGNSVFISVTVTLIVLLTSAITGYVLAKYEFRGRNVIFIAILATMMIPWPVTLIPNYQLMVWFKMLNTYWALIIPSLYSAFGIFLLRQFMHSIPNELIDAGRIDGASEPRIFVQIVLPLLKPALAALAIFVFQWNWDNFIWPLIVLNNQRLYTLPVALGTFQSDNVTDYASIMAGASITVIPMVLVYLLFQRYFVAGIAMTGLKS
jgi:ABC-type glycerol-3-phosphate transport system permease component